ncbi:unnamed protein product [Acanthoscelides obtectus]|uniref:PiggyBac transposable element-derived protein domain-containing protein n=1 Tax=Acanthoscelides obtectus TaxID=200917 RepID=A0A9P0M1I7_ACAOB|nr:unnamed protein product [Acanthoscelides obtectus]CAK1632802.1 hypothetical protein AOBTE_LOCUS7734 [Acanthoscelides obtectus]
MFWNSRSMKLLAMALNAKKNESSDNDEDSDDTLKDKHYIPSSSDISTTSESVENGADNQNATTFSRHVQHSSNSKDSIDSGRLILKQYIPQKTHKYGIKLFKLCCDNGYTWNLKIYAGKEQDRGTSLVNAFIHYKKVSSDSMTITKFRKNIIEKLLEGDTNQDPQNVTNTSTIPSRKSLKNHILIRKEGKAVTVRKYCLGCYRKKMAGQIQKNQVKKVAYFCGDCENKPHFCLSCFNEKHKKT